METFLSRYRNLSVLLLLIVAQLLLLAYQVKSNQDVRLIRVWAVTAVTPFARLVEWVRDGTGGLISDYILLRDVRNENKALREELGRTRVENYFLKAELAAADRVKALQDAQVKMPSKTLIASVIGTGTGSNSRVVYINRGSTAGIKRSMAVITPEGIVGKVIAAYPTASLVMLVTEQNFAAGVISQKNGVRGILRGQGTSVLTVEQILNESKVEQGEWFYTTGEDRIFPRGLPVGQVKLARPGRNFMEVQIQPSGLASGIDEVLVVIDGVHGEIPPPGTPPSPGVQILPAPPKAGPAEGAAATDPASPDTAAATHPAAQPPSPAAAEQRTDADRLKEKYRRIGEAQNHVYGAGRRSPDFTKAPPPPGPPPAQNPAAGQPGATTTAPAQPPAAPAAKPKPDTPGATERSKPPVGTIPPGRP